MAKTISYRQAGVDIDVSDQWTETIKGMVRRTYGPRVLSGVGGFAGLFRLDYDEKLFKRNYRKPVLVACTDGVGTSSRSPSPETPASSTPSASTWWR